VNIVKKYGENLAVFLLFSNI